MFHIHPSMDECWINEINICVCVCECMYIFVCMPESWCYNQFHFLCNQEVLHSSVFSMQEKKEDAEVHLLRFYCCTIILMYEYGIYKAK